jgi:3-oxoacyl-[acyl-carrier protein] reductase
MTDAPLFRLDGLRALVTGAGRGIGAAVARTLATQGAAVVINDIDAGSADALVTELGCRAVPGDVTDPHVAAEVVAAAADAVGSIDILVNNASAPVPLARFLDIDPSDWGGHLSSFHATLACSRAALPAMIDRGWGRIVSIGSISGGVGVDSMVLYGAGKGAIHAFTAGLAKEVAASGVTVNAVSPGVVDTPRQRSRPADELARRAQRIPLGRFANAEEIGTAVAFLCSRESAYITGEVLYVDGGRP